MKRESLEPSRPRCNSQEEPMWAAYTLSYREPGSAVVYDGFDDPFGEEGTSHEDAAPRACSMSYYARDPACAPPRRCGGARPRRRRTATQGPEPWTVEKTREELRKEKARLRRVHAAEMERQRQRQRTGQGRGPGSL